MDFGMIGAMVFAILAVAVNGIPQLLYAKDRGFKLKPVAYAYFLAAGLNLLLGSVTPISAQAETITVASETKNMKARIWAMVLAAAVMTVLGLLGLVSAIADAVGPAVVSGMMAGVGLMLCEVSYQFTAKNTDHTYTFASVVSILSAILSWMIFQNDPNKVVYTIGISVAVSTVVYVLLRRKHPVKETAPVAAAAEKTSVIKDYKAFFTGGFVDKTALTAMIVGTLNLVCMGIGCNISFGGITAGIANTTQNLNHLTLVNALADFVSVPAGGLPLEGIISGTAGAPNPVLTGVLMMAFVGILILTGVVEKLGKFVPAQAISGFLLMIGFFATVIPSLSGVIALGTAAALAAGGAAMAMTILSKNPFYGMLAGVVVNLLAPFLGL